MNHYEDGRIDSYLLESDPERFFKSYRQKPEDRIKCNLLQVGFETEFNASTQRFFGALQQSLKKRMGNRQAEKISVRRMVSEESNKLLNDDAYLLKNIVPLLIYKYRGDIRDLVKRYAKGKFLNFGHQFRSRVYQALHEELTAYSHLSNQLVASPGMLLKAIVSKEWLTQLSHAEDTELLENGNNRLVEKYQPVIKIKTHRYIDGTATIKEDIESDVTLMLLEKIEKGSLRKNYNGNGTVSAYLNTIIYRDVFTALKKQRPKIDTIPVSPYQHNYCTDSEAEQFEGNDQLNYYLNAHAQTLDAAMRITCRKPGQVERFKLTLMVLYGTEVIENQCIISLFPNCPQSLADEITAFANSKESAFNKDYFFGFLGNMLARIEQTEVQKGDSFRKNYERKEDKIWGVFTERHQINFNRRGRQNISYFEELVNYYFKNYSNHPLNS